MDMSVNYLDRRQRGDRRAGYDRRDNSDRRTGGDRRCNWGRAQDQRLQGAIATTEAITHLFGQPMTVISGYIDFLINNQSGAEWDFTEKLKIVKEQLDLLHRYIENMHSISEYRTVDIRGVTMLDITGSKSVEN